MKKLRIGIITSRGGHLYQMYRLKKWWNRYDRFWVTASGEDSASLLARERTYYGHFPETRNTVNALKNIALAIRVLLHEKPDVLVSCGAGIAPPFFYIGKLLGCRLIYIEPYDFIAYPTLSGTLVAPITDVMLVQHPHLTTHHRRAQFWGATL